MNRNQIALHDFAKYPWTWDAQPGQNLPSVIFNISYPASVPLCACTRMCLVEGCLGIYARLVWMKPRLSNKWFDIMRNAVAHPYNLVAFFFSSPVCLVDTGRLLQETHLAPPLEKKDEQTSLNFIAQSLQLFRKGLSLLSTGQIRDRLVSQEIYLFHQELFWEWIVRVDYNYYHWYHFLPPPLLSDVQYLCIFYHVNVLLYILPCILLLLTLLSSPSLSLPPPPSLSLSLRSVKSWWCRACGRRASTS